MITSRGRVVPWPGLYQHCPDWCDGLHQASDMHDDRRHISVVRTFPITSLIPHEGEPGFVHLYLNQQADESEAHVRLEDDNGVGLPYALHLTLTEAQRMGARLLDLATWGNH